MLCDITKYLWQHPTAMHSWGASSNSGRQVSASARLPAYLRTRISSKQAVKLHLKCIIGSDRPAMASHEEYNFSLNQYMVVLDKPIGITLAPDPTTGVVYVQDIQPGLSAADSKLVLVGDKLLLCSAVFGDDMWLASDLQRTRWAVNNRPGKVKLVFERSDGEPLPAWYFQGREGISSCEVPELQLPIRFATSVGGELSESLGGAGRSIAVSFNRCLSPPAPEQVRRRLPPGLAARRARTEELLLLLAEAAESPEVEVCSPSSRVLSGKEAARLQVGYPGSALAPSSQNVLPFRRAQQQQQQQQQSLSSLPHPGQPIQQQQQGQSLLPLPQPLGQGQPVPHAGELGGQQAGSNSSIPLTNNVTSSYHNNSGSGTTVDDYKVIKQHSDTSNLQGDSRTASNTQKVAPVGLVAPAAATASAGVQASGNSSGNKSSSGNGGNGSNSSTANAAAGVLWSSMTAAGAAGKVVQLLPWLLVSHGRLHGPELVHIATSRALGCLLEMGLLLNPQGLLCPRGSQPPAFSPPAAPVPPTLSPAASPTPAPANPPPLPAGQQQRFLVDEEEQQQQQQRQQQQPVKQQQQLQEQPDSSLLAGIAGPDTAFASAAAAAQAAAAASVALPSQRGQFGNQDTNSNSGIQGAGPEHPGNAAAASLLTLQAHHVLYCMADLQRLAIRRRTMRPTAQSACGANSSSSSSSSKVHFSHQLLLACDQGSWPVVSVLLAAWLHWHGGQDKLVAVAAVSQVMGVGVDEVLLQEVHRLLVVRAKERFSRVMLTWRYGGLSAEVSGELLGGWTQRVAMRKCMKLEGCLGASKGHFYLELKGLHPGRYHYKYIIDNTWAVDPSAPMSLDSQGNWNNVLEVKQPPTIETPEQQEHFATLQAACAAFETKLRPHSGSC